MSTRSVIAEPHGDTWRGRYCHSDGYPSWNGRILWNLCRYHGPETVRRVLLHDHYGWSFINPDETELSEYNRTGRFQEVAGWGCAYTTKTHQSDPDEWTTPRGAASYIDTEWAYLIGDGSLFVMLPTDFMTTERDWRIVAEVRYRRPRA